MTDVIVADEVCIPSWVNDLGSFRRWAKSDAYPERGWVSFLDGAIWLDMSMEQLFTHNRVKTCYTAVLSQIAELEELGYFFSDRVLLSHEGANLSTEPDGIFCSFAAVDDGRIRFV